MKPGTYSARRNFLRTAVPEGAILIMGNNDAPRNYVDNVYPFRQDSHFLYYAGANHPGLALLIEPDGKAVLYGTPEHRDDIIWFGPHLTLDDYAAQAGISDKEDFGNLGERLAQLQNGWGADSLPAAVSSAAPLRVVAPLWR